MTDIVVDVSRDAELEEKLARVAEAIEAYVTHDFSQWLGRKLDTRTAEEIAALASTRVKRIRDLLPRAERVILYGSGGFKIRTEPKRGD